MTLNCRVISVHSASQFTDEVERVTVLIEEADPTSNTFRVRNRQKLQLNEKFKLHSDHGYTDANAVPPVPGGPVGFVDSKPAGYISKGSGA